MLPFPTPTRTFPALPWRPLSDQEYAAVRALLPGAGQPGRRGRPPANLRRTLDAVFWVAASSAPWRALPAELGKPDSVHRTLCRWAQAGVLLGWLRALAEGRSPLLDGIGYWICRAFRRMARRLPESEMAEAQRLGLVDAWPARTMRFPNEQLSETARFFARSFRTHRRMFREIDRQLRNAPGDCPRLKTLRRGMDRLFIGNADMIALWQKQWLSANTSNRERWTLR
jgi:transposase